MDNKVLLHTTGNRMHYLAINQDGEEYEKIIYIYRCVYIDRAESLLSPETSTTL